MGDYYLFPANMKHIVYPFASDNDNAERISFSFNTTVIFDEMTNMNKSKPFLKVEHELIDDQVLTPTQKCLLLLLRRLQTAPKGCTPSHLYLKKRLRLKSSKTLVKHLDRLQLLGYITWQNRGKGNTNKFLFRTILTFNQSFCTTYD